MTESEMLFFLFALACGDKDDPTTDSGPETDADTDADADSDTDADADADSDADSDADADTDTDTAPPCGLTDADFTAWTSDEGHTAKTTFAEGDTVRMLGSVRNNCPFDMEIHLRSGCLVGHFDWVDANGVTAMSDYGCTDAEETLPLLQGTALTFPYDATPPVGEYTLTAHFDDMDFHTATAEFIVVE